MLSFFRVAVFEMILEAGNQGLQLPSYKGSTLRGGFGQAFRSIACSMRQKDCRGCLLKSSCPYAYVFETSPPVGSEVLRNHENIPRPFIIEPPLDQRTLYHPGEQLAFRLILIGNAIELLPYFIVAFRELGQLGIGKGRRTYELVKVRILDPENNKKSLIYEKENPLIQSANMTIRGDYYEKSLREEFSRHQRGSDSNASQRAMVRYLTMTRIKHEDNFSPAIEFHMLVRSLLRRISSLAYFHHKERLDLNYSAIIEQAAKVRIIDNRTRWVDWERFSSRQDSHVRMGGVVGEMVYEGNIAAFTPFLRLGELVHVGKGAVFGMGKFEASPLL
ncbi:hypothetical protein JOC69_000239 [Heliobacterium gestii]|nr:hypothetical protein [Heliomicrobium gestii]